MKHLMLMIALGLGTALWAELPAPCIHWKMDEIVDGRVPDATGGDNMLTLGAGCSLTNDVRFGRAVYFNGTSDAWGQATKTTAFTGARTVSIWFCRMADDGPMDPTVNKIPYLLNSISGMMVNYGWNNLAMSICPTGATSFRAFNASCVPRLEWHHAIFAIEPSKETDGNVNIRCYVNGLVTASLDDAAATYATAAQQVVVGNNAVGGTRPAHVMVADMRVYDQLLSAEDVMALYLEKATALPIRCVGYWPMSAFGVNAANQRIVEPAGSSEADLRAGDGVAAVPGISGTGVDFPNLTSSWLALTIPRRMAGFSFGVWMNFGTNLADLAGADTVDNKYPHVYALGGYCRVCIDQTTDKTLASNRAHMFDVRTLDESLDQGFFAPYVTVQKGKWSHFGATYEMRRDEETGLFGVQPRIYVDGVLVTTGRWQTANALTGTFPSDLTFMLGNNAVGGTRPFGGQMDELTFFTGVLSDEQMADLARGLPSVDAGTDFAVAGETARLNGKLGLTGTAGIRKAAKATPSWTLVSAPAGGEAATIENAADLRTCVTLPVAGSYVFRLTASMLGGYRTSDEVTVTRTATPAANQPPTVSIVGAAEAAVCDPVAFTATVADLDDAPGTLRVTWKRLAGPGAVRFESAEGTTTKATFFTPGTYRIVAVATDGADETVSEPVEVTVSENAAIDLTNGLIGYWPFEIGQTNFVDGTAYTVDRTTISWEKGVDGYGIRVQGAFYPYFNTGKTDFLNEMAMTPEGASYPTVVERWRSISCWIYHDTSDTNNSYNAIIAGCRNSWGLWYRCQNGDRGFSMYHQSLLDGQRIMAFNRPSRDPADRWTHVYAVFDRNTPYNQGNASALWIDGVLQTPTEGVLGRSRATGAALMVGGHFKNTEDNNGHFRIDGVLRSRTFPGILDEVRIYNRVLTEAEIKYLAANPVVDVNRAPAVDVDTVPESVSRKSAKNVLACAADDVAGVTGTWQVVGGDPAGVLFADAQSAHTTLVGKIPGVYRIAFVATDGSARTFSEVFTVEVTRDGTTIYLR